MAIPNPVSATVRIASLALDAASLRQKAIAANIANLRTEGYRPVQVDFESQLTRARTALQQGQALRIADSDGVAPTLVTRGDDAGALQDADALVADLSLNATHYQALSRTLGRWMSLQAIALQGGR